MMRSDKILPRYFFDNNYEVYIPDRSDWDEDCIQLNDDVVC